MRKFFLSSIIILFSFSATFTYLNWNDDLKVITRAIVQFFEKTEDPKSAIPINKDIISKFFKKYPNLKKYQSEVNTLYKNRNYKSIWYDDTKLIEFAYLLYSKLNLLEEEGFESGNIDYHEIIGGIFDSDSDLKMDLSKAETEIMLSAMYVFYVQKVFRGIEEKKVKEIGWFLPKKELSYESFLDTLLLNPKLLNLNENNQLGQYYKLREALKKYRAIEKRDDWAPIELDSSVKNLKPFDTSQAIAQIRHRLAVLGDLKQDSKSPVYDDELMAGVLSFKKRNGYKSNYFINHSHIRQMNIPVQEYIRKIMVNMERCRWIDPELTKDSEYVFINIPAFELLYKKGGETALESKLIVGQIMMETVVFSGYISSIVFSPYWNVPQSIIDTEIKYEMKQDSNYLASNNMEWNGGMVRQRPGSENPMGLVKFIFPNSNSIYLHDTPNKILFHTEYRAFSHGCINMDKAKELALLILKNDPDWPVDRINESMKGEEEIICVLKNKIPIYITYFTSWVDDTGKIHFYDDLYSRDDKLASLLFKK